MPTFSSKPLKGSSPVFDRLRRYPFLLFGLPFISIVVISSFALEGFTKTKYELHDTKVQAVSKEEEMKMRKDRKRVDIKEEYYRLANPELFQQSQSQLQSQTPAPSSLDADASSSSAALGRSSLDPTSSTTSLSRRKKFSFAPTAQDELENVRVPRPMGMPEWGPAQETAEDAPKAGSRSTDRWV